MTIYTILSSSIIIANRLIDIGWCWLTSIVIGYRFPLIEHPGSVCKINAVSL